MKQSITLAIAAIIAIAGNVAVAQVHDGAVRTASATASASAALADGEVRKVDKDAQKLTLRHGPIDNLGMPGMTMVFQVQDPAVLDRVKAGDKVRFAADKIGGTFTVTRIEALNKSTRDRGAAVCAYDRTCSFNPRVRRSPGISG